MVAIVLVVLWISKTAAIQFRLRSNSSSLTTNNSTASLITNGTASLITNGNTSIRNNITTSEIVHPGSGFQIDGHYFLIRVKDIPRLNPQLPFIHQPQDQPCGWLGANGESDAVCFPPNIDNDTSATISLPRASPADNSTRSSIGCVVFCGLMVQPSDATPYFVRVYRENDLGEKVLELTTNVKDNTGFRLRLMNETEMWLEIRVEHHFATPESWFQVSVATQLPKEPDGRRLAPTCFSDFNYLTGECYPADRRQLP